MDDEDTDDHAYFKCPECDTVNPVSEWENELCCPACGGHSGEPD